MFLLKLSLFRLDILEVKGVVDIVLVPAAAALLLQLWFLARTSQRLHQIWHGQYQMNYEWITKCSCAHPEIFSEGRVGPGCSKGLCKKKKKKLTTKTQGILFQIMKHNYKLHRDLPTHPVLWGFHFQTWRWNSVPGSFSVFSNNMTSLIKVSASYCLKKSQLENCKLKRLWMKKNSADTK